MTEPKSPNIFEREAIQLGYNIPKTRFTFNGSILDGISFRATVLAPDDEIVVHPSVLTKILNNGVKENGLIDIYIKREEV